MRKPLRHTADDSALGAALSLLWGNAQREASPRLSTANHMTAEADRKPADRKETGRRPVARCVDAKVGGPQTPPPAGTYTEQYVLDTFSEWLADNCHRFGFSASAHDDAVRDFQKSLRPQKSKLTQPVTAGGYLKGTQATLYSLDTATGKVQVENIKPEDFFQETPPPAPRGFIDYPHPYTPITTQRLRDLEAHLFCSRDCFRGRLTPTSKNGLMQREVMIHLDILRTLGAAQHMEAIEAIVSRDETRQPSLGILRWGDGYRMSCRTGPLFWDKNTSCFRPTEAACRANGLPIFLAHPTVR